MSPPFPPRLSRPSGRALSLILAQDCSRLQGRYACGHRLRHLAAQVPKRTLLFVPAHSCAAVSQSTHSAFSFFFLFSCLSLTCQPTHGVCSAPALANRACSFCLFVSLSLSSHPPVAGASKEPRLVRVGSLRHSHLCLRHTHLCLQTHSPLSLTHTCSFCDIIGLL